MQHVGLIAIIIYWVTVSSILYRWGYNSTKTISDHVATGRQKHIYTPLALTYFVLMSWFMYAWFLPSLEAGIFHYILITVAFVFLLLTFLIPRHGRYIDLHDFFASVVGTSFLIVLTSFILRDTHGLLTIVVIVWLAVMLSAGATLLRRGRAGYLRAQIFFFAVLNLLILFLTYTN